MKYKATFSGELALFSILNCLNKKKVVLVLWVSIIVEAHK